MKQHYLPRCYIKQFSNHDNSVFVLDLKQLIYGKDPRPQSKTPEVCLESNFYTVDETLKNVNQSFLIEDPLMLERFFSRSYEHKYGKVLKKAIHNNYLTKSDATVLAFSVLGIKFRSKFYRENTVKRIIPIVLNGIKSDYVKLINSFEDPEKKERAKINVNTVLDQALSDPTLAKDLHIYSAISQNSNLDSPLNRLVKVFLGLKWALLENQSPIPFITTDNPGYCIDKSENVHNHKFEPPFAYFIPLSPKIALYINSDETEDSFDPQSDKIILRRIITEEFVKLYNKASLLNFYSQIITNQKFGNTYLIDFAKSRIESGAINLGILEQIQERKGGIV